MTNVLTPDPQVSTLFGEVSLEQPRPEDMRLEAITAGLWHQSRFTGQTTRRVSLLEHSFLVWLLAWYDGATADQQLAALTHDFQEAFICDIPTPLKHMLGSTYALIEEGFEIAVRQRFAVGYFPRQVKVWDQQALAIECLLYRPAQSYATWTGLVDVGHLPIHELGKAAGKFARAVGKYGTCDLELLIRLLQNGDAEALMDIDASVVALGVRKGGAA
jgi:hypothetical protein